MLKPSPSTLQKEKGTQGAFITLLPALGAKPHTWAEAACCHFVCVQGSNAYCTQLSPLFLSLLVMGPQGMGKTGSGAPSLLGVFAVLCRSW